MGRSKAYEDIVGPSERDPEATRRIREHLAGQNGIEGIIAPSVVERATRLMRAKRESMRSGEYVSEKELLVFLRELKQIGWPVHGYSRMTSRQLYGYFNRVSREVLRENRRLQPS